MQSVVSVLGEVVTRRETFCHTALDAVSHNLETEQPVFAMAEQARHDAKQVLSRQIQNIYPKGREVKKKEGKLCCQ